MVVRVFGNKYKFCRLYDDDVFGTLTRRPKANQKILNLIYSEYLKKDYVYKICKKKVKILLRSVKSFKKKKGFWNILFNDLQKDKIRNLIDKFTFFFFFKQMQNIKFLNLNIINYLLIKLKTTIKSHLGVSMLDFKSNFLFNYRVDIGRPARKKKRFTLHCIRLLTRHRLRFFSSKMTARQFRSYVKKRRNSKFFGMFFIWMLETRIDTILYRLNLQSSAAKGRQYIKHFGIFINKKYINIPSVHIKDEDIFSIVNKKFAYRFLLLKFYKKMIFMSIPYYYEVNHRIMSMKFFIKPQKEMIFFPFNVEVEKAGGSGARF